MIRRPRRSPLFPYTPLFRPQGSDGDDVAAIRALDQRAGHDDGPAVELLSLLPQFLAGEVEAEVRSEEHTSELQSHLNLVCRLLLEKKRNIIFIIQCTRL